MSSEGGVNRSSRCRRKVRKTKRKQAYWQTLFLHIFPKIRFVKCVSSRILPELQTDTAWMQEETVCIHWQRLVIPSSRSEKFSVKRTNLVCSIVTPTCYSYWTQLLPNEKQDGASDAEKLSKVCAARSETRLLFSSCR